MAEQRRISPGEATKYLAGLTFPCSKQDVINCARQRKAPKEVLDMIELMQETIPNQKYPNMMAVTSALTSN